MFLSILQLAGNYTNAQENIYHQIGKQAQLLRFAHESVELVEEHRINMWSIIDLLITQKFKH